MPTLFDSLKIWLFGGTGSAGPPASLPAEVWPMDVPRVAFSRADAFTARHACESVLITGAVGAGKTATAIRTFADAYLRTAGMGMFFTTTKPDDRKAVKAWIRATATAVAVVFFSLLLGGYVLLRREAPKPEQRLTEAATAPAENCQAKLDDATRQLAGEKDVRAQAERERDEWKAKAQSGIVLPTQPAPRGLLGTPV